MFSSTSRILTLKRVDAPVGVKPALKCWMEINEG